MVFCLVKITHRINHRFRIMLTFCECTLSDNWYWFILLAVLSFWLWAFTDSSFGSSAQKEVVMRSKLITRILFFLFTVFFLAPFACKTSFVLVFLSLQIRRTHHSSTMMILWRYRGLSIFLRFDSMVAHHCIKSVLKIAYVDCVNSFISLTCSSLNVINPFW